MKTTTETLNNRPSWVSLRPLCAAAGVTYTTVHTKLKDGRELSESESEAIRRELMSGIEILEGGES